MTVTVEDIRTLPVTVEGIKAKIDLCKELFIQNTTAKALRGEWLTEGQFVYGAGELPATAFEESFWRWMFGLPYWRIKKHLLETTQ